jgi:hypothetical protein
MTDEETRDFVTKFAATWAARDSEAFLALWHPDGVLFSPLTNRLIAGNELGRLNELQEQSAPDLASGNFWIGRRAATWSSSNGSARV